MNNFEAIDETAEEPITDDTHRNSGSPKAKLIKNVDHNDDWITDNEEEEIEPRPKKQKTQPITVKREYELRKKAK